MRNYIFKIISFISLALTIFIAGFYFKDAILKVYNDVGENLQEFEKTDFGKIIGELKKEILAPPPLNIGGKENQVVLTKAKIIAETNIQRYNNGNLPPLIENAKLNAAAKAKAEDMFNSQYFEHISPSGVDPGTLVKIYGYDYIVTGENLILGNFLSEKEVVESWMASPGHRANILNNRFVDIGVAIIKGTYKGQTVWIGVQEFGLSLDACLEPDLNLKNQIEFNKKELDNLEIQINLKREEINNTNRRSPQYNQLVDEYNQLVAKYNSLNDEIKNLIVQYNAQVSTFNQCVRGEG